MPAGLVRLGVFAVIFFAGCNDAAMSGGSGKAPAEQDQSADSTPTDADGFKPSSGDVDPGDDNDTDTDLVLPTVQPNPNNNVPVLNLPSIPVADVVDGMDVVTECTQCFPRAQQIAAAAGFQVYQNTVKNLGYYKIPFYKNLCDIHYFTSADVEVSDHEGVESSVLDRQVALYCPCNCPF